MISPRCQCCGAYVPGNSEIMDIETVFRGSMCDVQTFYRCPRCDNDVILKETYEIIGRKLIEASTGESMWINTVDGEILCPMPGCDGVLRLGPTMINEGPNTDILETSNEECFCTRCKNQYRMEFAWRRRHYEVGCIQKGSFNRKTKARGYRR